MIKEFIKYYKPYKKLFLLDLVVALIAAACDLVYPWMTKELLNISIPNKDLNMVVVFAITLIIIFVIKAVCAYIMQYWGHVVGVRMQGDMRRELFTHLQKLPNKYFDNTKTGELMSRIVNDLNDISELAHHGPEDLFISLIMMIGSFLILININVILTLIIFTFIPFIIIFTFIQRKRMHKAFLKTRIETGEVNGRLQNSISGIKLTKAFVNYKSEIEKFEVGNKRFINARESAYRVMGQYFSGANFSVDLLNYIVLIAGGIFTIYDKINIGDFMAYVLYIKMFTDPIKKLINFMEQYQNGMTGFTRYKEIMSEEVEEYGTDKSDLENVEGNIEFKDVHFGYENSKILSGISLKIKKGNMLALVGPSGGGKSTFCNLIPRFYNVDSGDIFIDNKSIYDVNLDSLRKNIGIVQQEVFLFTGTIRDNILYGKVDATEEEVINACKMANIYEFIVDLEDGFDTFIGERGVKLSGGQKQRISIARVFLKNPPILILDEATSALDNTTECMIQKSIEKLCKGRTTIVVAHRLSTIRNADEIIVLTDRGIEEKGTHESLLANNGIYSQLYNYVKIEN